MAKRKSGQEENTKWQVALYIRLSKEDGNIESLSVKNQKELLLEFLEKSFSGGYDLIDVYIDDGQTGTDSDREAFQRMLDDIGKRRVNCVIVKDASRLSRNYVEAGHYMEILFVKMDVRFISLELPQVDSYLQPEQMNSIAVPIQNVINDDFCRQTSLKVRRVFDYKRRNGKFIGAFAPYGYVKDKDDRNSLVVDENAAETVRDIFHWFIKEGMSKIGIAKRLNELGVPNPSAYKRQNGLKYRNPNLEKCTDASWNPKTINDILQNQMYLGHMVQGKQEVKSYKVHTRVSKDEGDWFVCENTHEAIIDEESFAAARSLHKRDTRTANGNNRVHLFSGFIRCAGCKKAMQRKKSRSTWYFVCRSKNEKGLCTSRSVRFDILENAVLTAIREQIKTLSPADDLIGKVRQRAATGDKSKRFEMMMNERLNEKNRIQNVCDSLYPDKVGGVITNEEYLRLKQEYTRQLERIGKAIEKIASERDVLEGGETGEHPAFSHFASYKSISALDRNLLVELIDTIYIGEKQTDGKIPIEIVFSYMDRPRLK